MTQELVGAGREPPTSRAFLDIAFEDDDGALVPHPRRVLNQHNVIGRAPGVAVVLDHDTVSRKHAEVFLDPFGRWWVRDLGSTNGTTVNGERVAERILRPMDRIDCGDFRLVFLTAAAPDAKRAGASLEETLDGTAAPSWLRTLRDIDPPQVSATQLGTLMEFSRRILSTEDPAYRWDYYVRDYSDQAQQASDPKFVPSQNGILYPRAGTLGGCTAHNAMITVYPSNSD